MIVLIKSIEIFDNNTGGFYEIRNLKFYSGGRLWQLYKAAQKSGLHQSLSIHSDPSAGKRLGIPYLNGSTTESDTEKGKEILNLTHELFRTAEAIKKTADNPLTLSGPSVPLLLLYVTGCSRIILNSSTGISLISPWRSSAPAQKKCSGF